MRLGQITKYRVGDSFYGITILNIFSEGYIFNPITRQYKYYPTTYYISYKRRLWLVEEYKIDTEVEYQKSKFYKIKKLIILIKDMLEKYEG